MSLIKRIYNYLFLPTAFLGAKYLDTPSGQLVKDYTVFKNMYNTSYHNSDGSITTVDEESIGLLELRWTSRFTKLLALSRHFFKRDVLIDYSLTYCVDGSTHTFNSVSPLNSEALDAYHNYRLYPSEENLTKLRHLVDEQIAVIMVLEKKYTL